MGQSNNNQNTTKHQFNGAGRPKHKGSVTTRIEQISTTRTNWDTMVEAELLQLKEEAKGVNKTVLERVAILRAENKLKQLKKDNGPIKQFSNNPFSKLPEMVFTAKESK